MKYRRTPDLYRHARHALLREMSQLLMEAQQHRDEQLARAAKERDVFDPPSPAQCKQCGTVNEYLTDTDYTCPTCRARNEAWG